MMEIYEAVAKKMNMDMQQCRSNLPEVRLSLFLYVAVRLYYVFT